MLSNFTFIHENVILIFIISYKSNDYISIKQQNSSSYLVNNLLSLPTHCNPQENISSLFPFLSPSLFPSFPSGLLSFFLPLPLFLFLSLYPPSLSFSISLSIPPLSLLFLGSARVWKQAMQPERQGNALILSYSHSPH